jgi:hypothetical protein
LARPPEAPVYHGFPILDDVEVDGFKFGMITDFEAEPASDGDAFAVAPDGKRAKRSPSLSSALASVL